MQAGLVVLRRQKMVVVTVVADLPDPGGNEVRAEGWVVVLPRTERS